MVNTNVSRKTVDIDPAKMGKHMIKIVVGLVVVGVAWSALYH